ncbi:unnamed protein product [Gongylonema pulchrum]|uniref:DUF3453 domain-containing protein n=1 Tax=Gongylonema pulchrum TaxID=637853 RepID=A0A183CZA8_9BILA|nr:unnamed protein product [Gongylonema pulchrum]
MNVEIEHALKWATQIANLCSSRLKLEERLVNLLIDVCSILSRMDVEVRNYSADFTENIYKIVGKIFELDLKIEPENIGELFAFISVVLEKSVDLPLLYEVLNGQLTLARERYFETEILENISRKYSDGEDVLFSVISLITAFADIVREGTNFWLAVISLPWLQTAVLLKFT